MATTEKTSSMASATTRTRIATFRDRLGTLTDIQACGELMASADRPAPDPAAVQQLHAGLAENIQRDPQGRPQRTFTLENEQALQDLAQSLARLFLPPPQTVRPREDGDADSQAQSE
jgi:hypothetical protein